MCLLKTKGFSVFATCISTTSGHVAGKLTPSDFIFEKGVYALAGDIDSGGWALTTALSPMDNENCVLGQEGELYYNNQYISLDDIRCYTCSLDRFNPVADMPDTTVRQMVNAGLTSSQLPYSADEIMKLFCIDPVRFEKPLSTMGHQLFNATAAIGFSQGKEIYCFPWIGTHHIIGNWLIHVFRVCNILAGL